MLDPKRVDPDSAEFFESRQPGLGSGGALLRDPWGVVRRNLLLIFGCTGVLAGGTAYYTSRITPVYQAETSIRIDEEQSQLPALDILRLTGGNELDTEMEMLRSRSLAEDVADSLDLHLELLEPTGESRGDIFTEVRVPRDAVPGEYVLQRQADGHFRLADAASDSTIATVAPGGRITLGGAEVQLAGDAGEHEFIGFRLLRFEDAVLGLEGRLSVGRPNREANLVRVAVEGTDPELIRDIANVLTARFIEARRDVQQTQTRSTVTFLEDQLAKLTRELRRAEDELRSFREREQVVSLKDEATTGVSQLAEVRAQRNAIEAERVALARLLDQVRGSAQRGSPASSSPYRELAAFPTLLRNSAVVSLLSSLAATEASRAELLPNSTRLDPDVQVLDRHSRELEQQLESITQNYLKGLESQVAALDSGIATSERRLGAIPQRELRFARLDREAKSLEGIVTLLQSRLKEAEIAQAVSDPSVRLVDSAILPAYPIRPNLNLNLALAVVAGLTLGLAVAFLREYRDHSVHTRKDVLFATGAPVLGLIPHSRGRRALAAVRNRKSAPRRIAPDGQLVPRSRAAVGQRGRSSDTGRLLLPGADRQGPLAEANNSLATNLAFARPDTALQLLVVTSPSPGDGKTTTAVNLAITLAERGRRVLLVDADLRRGAVSAVLGLNRAPGLTTVLTNGVDFRTVVQRVDLHGNAQLHVLTTGTLPENPAILLASAAAQRALQAFREDYDIIVIDSPPANAAGDAAVLGANSDGVLVVARAGVTATQALAFTMEQLHAVRAPVLGGVLNDIDFDRDITYDGTYRYSGYRSVYAQRTEAAP